VGKSRRRHGSSRGQRKGVAPVHEPGVGVCPEQGRCYRACRYAEFFLISLTVVGAPLVFSYGDNTFRLPKEVFHVAMTILLAAVVLVRWIEVPRLGRPRHPLLWPVVFGSGVFLLGTLLSQSLANAVHDLIFLASFLLFFAIAEEHLRERFKENVLVIFMLTVAVLSAIYGVCQYFEHDFLFQRRAGYYSRNWLTAGFVGQPTLFAGYLGPLVPLAVGRLAGSRRWWERLLLGGVLALILTTIFLTYTRAVIFMLPPAFLLGLGLVAWVYPRMRRRALAVGVVFLVVCAGIFAFFWQEVPGFQKKMEDTFHYGTSGTYRLFFWQVAAEMALDHPILGVGPGGYRYHAFDYRCRVLERGTSLPIDVATPLQTHNEWLQILAEGGLAGFFCWSWLLAVLGVLAYRYLRDKPPFGPGVEFIGLVVGLVMFLGNAVFSFPLHIVPSASVVVVLAAMISARAVGRGREEAGS
jgi:O-antigen ligase